MIESKGLKCFEQIILNEPVVFVLSIFLTLRIKFLLPSS